MKTSVLFLALGALGACGIDSKSPQAVKAEAQVPESIVQKLPEGVMIRVPKNAEGLEQSSAAEMRSVEKAPKALTSNDAEALFDKSKVVANVADSQDSSTESWFGYYRGGYGGYRGYGYGWGAGGINSWYYNSYRPYYGYYGSSFAYYNPYYYGAPYYNYYYYPRSYGYCF